MIRLHKSAEPNILRENAVAWTELILNKIAAQQELSAHEKSLYNHTNIKEALLLETNGKCAYCESKLRHITYGDIEHVVPKSLDPLMWFNWDNLTIACDVCNTKKADHPTSSENFVDPYGSDPEDQFWHFGFMIYPRPGCDAAALTERLLDLNRSDLIERRGERLDNLLKILEVIERCSNLHLKNVLWNDFLKESDNSREFAGLARFVTTLARAKLGRLES